MSKEHDLVQHNAVVLAAYPSCEDCLAWSDDGLAVAGGQNVYILKRVLDNAQHISQSITKWSSIAVRTDQFSHDEWPEQNLAALHHLSVGEEQSESVVVGLSWSPPGLGFHRRSVLAVLTSNLILSIWETDGSQRGWQRTCILNPHLPTPAEDDTGRARRWRRIRAFTWSEPLLTSPAARWGNHHIAVVDDDSNLTFFSISKKFREGYGQWSLTVICTTIVAPRASQHDDPPGMTDLQRMINRKSSVERVLIDPWHIEYADARTGHGQYKARSSLCCIGSHGQNILELSIEIMPVRDGVTGTIRPSSLANVQNTRSRNLSEIGVYDTPHEDKIVHGLIEKREWHEALEQICTEYDRQNDSDGLFRVRFWAFAKSPDSQMEAACITLHPWDTYEYTSAVNEKSRVVFRSLGTPGGSSAVFHRSEDDVLESVLKFVVQALHGREDPLSALDDKLLRALYAWTSLRPGYAEIQETIRKEWTDHTGTAYSSSDVRPDCAQILSGLRPDSGLLGEDLCDICGSQIPVTATTAIALCSLGHPFSRCSLSLLSIQEPGISKYCEVCGRPFLNISKLGPQPGQSLLIQLFDEFDTCPYCGGKYCG